MASSNSSPTPGIATTPWLVLLTSLLVSVSLFGLDNTVTASSQAVIVHHFNATNKITWFSIAYLGGAAGTNLFWGQTYSQFNVKWLFLLTFGIFEVGSIVCASAPDVDAFIVGRAICGVGGAGMYVGLSIIITTNVKPEQRPLYFSLIGFSRAIGTVMGPIIGGALATHADWRWAFYLNPLVGAPCTLAYLVTIPCSARKNDAKSLARLLNIDFVGTALLCGALVSILMAISFGGTLYSWQDGRIIALFIVSGVLLAAFLVQQRYTIFTRQRSFPIQFLAQPTILSLFVSTSCSLATIFVRVYSLPLYFQFVHDYSALQSGVRLLPYIVSNVVTLLANGFVMRYYPYYMPWYLAGGAFSVAGAAAMYTITASTSLAKIYGFSVLLGVGGGAASQLAFSVIQAKVDRALVATAMAFCVFSQLLGPAFALSISNAVFLNRATIGIHNTIPGIPRSVVQEVISGASESHALPGVTHSLREEAVDIVVRALRKVFLLPLSAGALTILLALFMQRERLFTRTAPTTQLKDSQNESGAGNAEKELKSEGDCKKALA